MSFTSFPTVAVVVVGVFAALILLGSYYILVIKCCLSWHRSETSSQIRRRRQRGIHSQSLPLQPLDRDEPHGLDESTIKSIPTVAYRKPNELGNFHVCPVCINEFQEEEKLRVLPNCLHFFHVDCIDTWLRENANCPLCRSPITTNPTSASVDQEMDRVLPAINSEVAINVGEDDVATVNITPTNGGKGNSGKWSCRGDESIETRREKKISVMPIRRSFSVDSSADRWLSKEVQRVLQQNPHFHATPLAGSSGTVPKLPLPLNLHGFLNASSS